MALLLNVYVAVSTRLADLNRPDRRDRGESPVPTVIIIAGLAILAIAVLSWAYLEAQNYMDQDFGNMPTVPK